MNNGQESISQIQDNLQNLVSSDNETQVNVQTDIKTGTVVDIINKKINSLEDYLDSKVINIYQRPWNKLEIKLKLKKIEEYFNLGPVENEVDESETKKSKKKMVEAYDEYNVVKIKSFCNSSEKKRLKVDYDEKSCRINSIQVVQ
jgi:hypothetical protein